MEKIKSLKGYVIYKVTKKEMEKLDSPGICDECLAMPDKGFLIPVLNRYLCKECCTNWIRRSKGPDHRDVEVETKNALYYERVLGTI